MNSDEMWLLQLWSGTFGAAIGAIAAALVALMVVKRTNKLQLDLAEDALELQARLADAALEEQRLQAAAALKAQKEALTQQLHEQRAEASKGRMIVAVTDMIEAVHQMGTGYRRPHETHMANYRQAYSAAHRWHIEDAGELDLAMLLAWPQWLLRLSKAADQDHENEASRNAALDALSGAGSFFQVWASQWPNATGERRQEVREKLQAALLMMIATGSKTADAHT